MLKEVKMIEHQITNKMFSKTNLVLCLFGFYVMSVGYFYLRDGDQVIKR